MSGTGRARAVIVPTDDRPSLPMTAEFAERVPLAVRLLLVIVPAVVRAATVIVPTVDTEADVITPAVDRFGKTSELLSATLVAVTVPAVDKLAAVTAPPVDKLGTTS